MYERHSRLIAFAFLLLPNPNESQTHLQLFISRLGQFSGQCVQSLLDRPVHRQHVGQLAQRWIQLACTEKQMTGRNEQFMYATRAAATRKVIEKGQRDSGLTALESRASLRICLAVRTSSSSSSQLFRVQTCCCTRTHRRSITCTRRNCR